MIQIEKIFFCDHFEQGQFGKLDIRGLIPSNILSLSKTPYDLLSHLIIIGKTDEQFECLSLNLCFENIQGNTINKVTLELTGPAQKPNTVTPLFLIQPIKITINSFGELNVSVVHGKIEIYRERYEIVQGPSPYSGIQGHIPASGIFKGNDKTDIDFVINLLGTANQSLKIFENYVSPQRLKELVSKVPKTTQIEIVTSPKSKKIFLSDQSLNKLLPNTEIKTSVVSHDRFVIINDSEYYHFGHSLKDVSAGKVSRFSKITTEGEVIKLRKIWDDAWKTSSNIAQ